MGAAKKTPHENLIRVVHWEKSSLPSEQEIEAHLHKEGYEAFKWHDVGGTHYPSHRHDRDECLWISSGEIIFEIEGVDYSLKNGDRLYLPSKLKHVARVPAGQAVTYFVGQKRSS